MAGESLVYSNARVKAMENSLLSHEKITRMTYASSLDEAVKILYENNYANGLILDNSYNYEELFRVEEGKVATFMREAMPERSGLECFLVRLDYHNAKALFKAKLLGEKADYMLLPSGLIAIDKLKEAFDTDNYFSLPKAMASAIAAIHGAQGLNEIITPRLLDVTLDKAMYADILERLKRVKAKSIHDYWRANIDLGNVSAMIRLKSIDGGEKLLKDSLIEGGEISVDSLVKMSDTPIDNIIDKLRYTDYSKIIASGLGEYKNTKSLVAFEREWDNYLLDLFRRDRYDIFSVAPIAGFYVAKGIEQKVARLIFVCLKNNVDVSQIKMRLRDIYA